MAGGMIFDESLLNNFLRGGLHLVTIGEDTSSLSESKITSGAAALLSTGIAGPTELIIIVPGGMFFQYRKETLSSHT